MFNKPKTKINDSLKARAEKEKQKARNNKQIKDAQKLINDLKKQTGTLLETTKKLGKDKIEEKLKKAQDELKKEVRKFQDQGKKLNKKSLPPNEWESFRNKLLKVENYQKSLARVEKLEKIFLKQAKSKRATGKIAEKKISDLKATETARSIKDGQKIVGNFKKLTSTFLDAAKNLGKDAIKKKLEESKNELRKEVKKFKAQGKELNQKSLTPNEWRSLSNKLAKVKNNKKFLAIAEKHEKTFLTQAKKHVESGKILEKRISVLKAPDVAKKLSKERKNLETMYKKLSKKYGSKDFKDFKSKLTKEEKTKLQNSLKAIKNDKAKLEEASKNQKTFKLQYALDSREKLVKELKEKYKIEDPSSANQLNTKLLDPKERAQLINATKEVLELGNAAKEASKPKTVEPTKQKIEIASKGPLSPTSTPTNNNKGRTQERSG